MHCKLIDGNGKLIGFGTFWAMVVCLKEICVCEPTAHRLLSKVVRPPPYYHS